MCLSNLRQLGASFQMYVNQNKGKAFVGYGESENIWPWVLRPYFQGGRLWFYTARRRQRTSATPPVPLASGFTGTAFHAWANSGPGLAWDAVDIESSYGMNGWVMALRPAVRRPWGS